MNRWSQLEVINYKAPNFSQVPYSASGGHTDSHKNAHVSVLSAETEHRRNLFSKNLENVCDDVYLLNSTILKYDMV